MEQEEEEDEERDIAPDILRFTASVKAIRDLNVLIFAGDETISFFTRDHWFTIDIDCLYVRIHSSDWVLVRAIDMRKYWDDSDLCLAISIDSLTSQK